MEFKDVVLKRRMVRNFADRPVDPTIIDRILELTKKQMWLERCIHARRLV